MLPQNNYNSWRNIEILVEINSRTMTMSVHDLINHYYDKLLVKSIHASLRLTTVTLKSKVNIEGID